LSSSWARTAIALAEKRTSPDPVSFIRISEDSYQPPNKQANAASKANESWGVVAVKFSHITSDDRTAVGLQKGRAVGAENWDWRRIKRRNRNGSEEK